MNRKPCKDCKDRHIGCHSTCEKHKQVTDLNRQISEARRKDNEFYGYRAEQSKKMEIVENKRSRK